MRRKKNINKECRDIFERMMSAVGIKSFVGLSKDLGITPQAINSYMSRKELPYKYVVKFSKKHNLSLDWLFGEKTLASAGKSGIKTKSPVVADTLGEYLAEDELCLLEAYRALAPAQKEHVINTIKILGEGRGGHEVSFKKNHEGQ